MQLLKRVHLRTVFSGLKSHLSKRLVFLMNHPKIATVLATGGPGMVKAAYSTGKPALGVGAGNVPSYIAADAKVKRAVNDIIVSKTF